MLVGQFYFSTFKQLGLQTTGLLRNTVRPREKVSRERRETGMRVDLSIFRDGQLVFEQPGYADIPLGGLAEISESTCPVIAEAGPECLISARCSLPSASPDETPAYLPQEHQIIYTNPRNGHTATVLYDQMPTGPLVKGTSPIVLLAPKTWVSRMVNSYVVFCNTLGDPGCREQAEPMVVSVLSQDGEMLHTAAYELNMNDTWIFDVRAAVADHIPLTDEPVFLNVVARGGASLYVIMTMVYNERSGNLAIEHSLSPHYYVPQSLRDRLRREALAFPGGGN